MSLDARAATARRAAQAGAGVAADLFREELAVERKDGKTDLVTRADREAEAAVLDGIAAAFPDEPVVAEESASGAAVPESGPAWVVDPIDGTNNFVHGIPVWATAVAAVVDGEAVGAAVVLPALGDTYVADGSGARLNGEPLSVSPRTDPDTQSVAPTFWWGLDRRAEYGAAATEIVERFGDLVRFRSAQATLSMVAAGSLDATFTNRETNAWDTVAGAFLVRQAGGRVTDLAGEPWRHDSRGLVASSGHNHDSVVAAARAVDEHRTE
ncbi:inositol monophosphatase family protein [Halosimplex pelagicum]|uniref:fructose-bisphosphatase n=1 Tax=Halosimplex pelagicum TaxID=869886 RepID=A0A7D5TFN1_9EURY|nr:inositol monophosphatase [Halosimplex pelagicum]QLH80556.1 inositol monophosphatase [Halosimplex pelagicum]